MPVLALIEGRGRSSLADLEARVAQLDRALASGAKGCGFKSRLAHHFSRFSHGFRQTPIGCSSPPM